MCADSPDYSGMNRAAEANAEIAKEALDWYKQMYAEQAPLREQAAARANAVSDAQLASMKQNDAISQDYWNYQKSTFRPLERSLVADSQNYDTEARRAAAAGKAMADVQQQMDAAQGQQQRQMMRMGVNPNDGRFAAMQNQTALAGALGKAKAATDARSNVELQGYARRMDAANLGRGLASSQATSAGVALNAGNSAATTGQMPLTQAQSAAQTMGQGFNTAISANNSAGNIYGTMATAQANNQYGFLGDLATIGMSAAKLWPTSDKGKKKNVKPVNDEAALEAVKKTPVAKWDYKDGEGDGGSHVGPMAQDVQKTMGEQAAPGGKVLDLITMNGVTMAGMSALAKKVDRLEKKVEGAKA